MASALGRASVDQAEPASSLHVEPSSRACSARRAPAGRAPGTSASAARQRKTLPRHESVTGACPSGADTMLAARWVDEAGRPPPNRPPSPTGRAPIRSAAFFEIVYCDIQSKIMFSNKIVIFVSFTSNFRWSLCRLPCMALVYSRGLAMRNANRNIQRVSRLLQAGTGGTLLFRGFARRRLLPRCSGRLGPSGSSASAIERSDGRQRAAPSSAGPLFLYGE
jgi:hypothetical protein